MSPVPPHSEDPPVAEPTPATPGSDSNSSAEQPSSDSGSVRPSSAAGQSLGWEPPSPEELSRLLPEYEIHELIGAGGMGAVYRATELKLMRPIAMKILLRGVGLDFGFEERFRREAHALANLCHPNIVTVYNFGEAGSDYLFLAMEYIQGTSLAHLLADRSLPCQHHLALLPQVCEALEMAHSKGIVHRDIKPANIMVNQAGRVKMLDFGLAKRFDVANSLVTRTGAAMGTPGYAAPEQFEGGPVDHRADLYAMGVLLYRILTGHIPRGIWLPPSEAAQVDPAWDEVAIKALMAEPEARWQSATALREQIEQVLNKRPPPPAPAPAPRAMVTARPQVSGAAKPSSPRPPSAGARSSAAKRISPARVPAAAKKEKKPAAPALMATLLGVVLLAGLLLWSPWKNAGGVSAPQPAAHETGRNAQIETLEYRDLSAARPGETKVLDLGGGVKMELVAIPPGEFMLGSTKEERAWALQNGAMENEVKLEGEQPRKARIKNGFWLGRTEVTVGQWKEFVAATNHRTDAEKAGKAWGPTGRGKANDFIAGAHWNDTHFDDPPQENHAVCYMSWNDAMAFCDWLTQRERQAGRLLDGFAFRLPTEAEWEYACRAGTQTRFWWGDAESDGKGRLNWLSSDDGHLYVSPADNYGATGRNGFGLADMLGNVAEWCMDDLDAKGAHEEYYKGDYRRVVRGLGFGFRAGGYRCAWRSGSLAIRAEAKNGFRVCLGPDVLGSVAADSNAPPVTAADDAGRQNAINLLPLIDPQKDAVAGSWRKEDDALTVEPLDDARLQIPYRPPEEYDFEIEFTFHSGAKEVVQVLSGNGRPFAWKMGAYRDPSVFTFQDGKKAAVLGSLELQRRHRSTIQVRKDSVSALVDGRVVIQHKTDYRDFGMEPKWALREPAVLGIGAFLTQVLFHRIEVREVTGKGTFTRGAPSPSAASITGHESRITPADAAFCAEVAALPAEQHLARVVAKLKELNPGYDGQAEHKIENGAVTELSFSTAAVADISPVRALSGLRVLICEGNPVSIAGSQRKGKLADLSPLRGLKLEEFRCSGNRIADLTPLVGMPLKGFTCYWNLISDLGPLAGMPLRWLSVSGNKISDLSPLKGMALVQFMCNEPQVTDLSALTGMPLDNLSIGATSVTDLSPVRGMRLKVALLGRAPIRDLSPLAGMPLKELTCNFVPQRDTSLLRSIKTLEKINGLPAAEFWKKVDAGEVPKP